MFWLFLIPFGLCWLAMIPMYWDHIAYRTKLSEPTCLLLALIWPIVEALKIPKALKLIYLDIKKALKLVYLDIKHALNKE